MGISFRSQPGSICVEFFIYSQKFLTSIRKKKSVFKSVWLKFVVHRVWLKLLHHSFWSLTCLLYSAHIKGKEKNSIGVNMTALIFHCWCVSWQAKRKIKQLEILIS